MAENSGIEWTDHTFNPWMGCTKVSPACKNCYAERDFDHRYGKVSWGPNGTRVVTSDANWRKPMKWNAEANGSEVRPRVFCASLADVFEDWRGPMQSSGKHAVVLGNDWKASRGSNRLDMHDVRARLFEVIDATPNLDWLILTKRPENVLGMWPSVIGDAYRKNIELAGPDGTDLRGNPRLFRPNVWLGTSIENQEWADKRLAFLEDAKFHGMVDTTFVSAEPLVGPIALGDCHPDWVITGGESGPNARPCHPDWFRSLRDQCDGAGTAFHFKQWGEFDEHQERVGKKIAGRLLDGRTHDGLPSRQTSPKPL